MSLDKKQIDAFGAGLGRPLEYASAIDPLGLEHPGLSVENVCAIESVMVSDRIATELCVVGKKVGVTSKIVTDMLGVNRPDFSHLLSSLIYDVLRYVDGQPTWRLRHSAGGRGVPLGSLSTMLPVAVVERITP